MYAWLPWIAAAGVLGVAEILTLGFSSPSRLEPWWPVPWPWSAPGSLLRPSACSRWRPKAGRGALALGQNMWYYAR